MQKGTQSSLLDSPTTTRQGGLYDDLGSSGFVIPSQKPASGLAGPSNSRGNKKKPSSVRRETSTSSEDEIDSLHGSQADSSDRDRWRVTKIKKPVIKAPAEGKMDRKDLEYHPEYPPRPRALPNFRKKKDTSNSEASSKASTPVPPSGGPGPSSRARSKADHPPTTISQLPSTTLSLLASLKNSENTLVQPQSPSVIEVSGEETSSVKLAGPSRAKNKTEAREDPFARLSPLRKSRSPSPCDESTSSKKRKEKGKAKSKSKKPSNERSILDADHQVETPKATRPRRKRRTALVPSSSMLTSSQLHNADSSEPDVVSISPRSKKRSKTKDDRSSPSSGLFSTSPLSDLSDLADDEEAIPPPSSFDPKTPSIKLKLRTKAMTTNFPMPSPLSSQADAEGASAYLYTPTRHKGEEFPFLSPLQSQKSSPENLLQLRGLNSEDKASRGAPFPVSFSPQSASKAGESSGTALEVSVWDPEEDGIDISGVSSDPSMLCPYCDALLPPPHKRTKQLKKLLSAAARHSVPCPRPGNPLARRAPVSVHGEVCARHEFESTELPRAREQRWPESIDWLVLRTRVEAMQARLMDIVQGVGSAREDSPYWCAVVEELRRSGSRAVTSLKGQFQSFEKVQPGYYGEIGANIIYQTLRNLFPPTELDAASLAPLGPDTVLQRVLVPETALALIIEDTGEDPESAIRIMKESARYGAAMFSLNDAHADEDGEHDAGQGMIMERARARARQMAVEDDIEERMVRKAKRKSRRAKDTSGCDGSEASSTRASRSRNKRFKPTPESEPASESKPRPKPRAVVKLRTANGSADDPHGVASTSSAQPQSGFASSTSTSESERETDSDCVEVTPTVPRRQAQTRPASKRATTMPSDSSNGSSDEDMGSDYAPTPRVNRTKARKANSKAPVSLQRKPSSSAAAVEVLDSSDSEIEVIGIHVSPSANKTGKHKTTVGAQAQEDANDNSWLFSD